MPSPEPCSVLKYLPAVSERARVELMRMAAHKTRPPKQKKARSLAQLRADWKQSAMDTSKVAADVIASLLERARAAAARVRVRARVAAVVDVALPAVDVAAAVSVMNGGGRFHRRHLLAEARRHLALVLRESRPDVEALDLTAGQLRRVTDAFTKADGGARERSRKYAAPEGAPAPRPAREDDQPVRVPVQGWWRKRPGRHIPGPEPCGRSWSKARHRTVRRLVAGEIEAALHGD
ncbi:hypothetical protein ABZ454_37330 [Streptomyces sp. NPDC005803]|uniref:hypothetical protein n=1 Tax=Streptomyces sp. NPDC005803 TaxID=3154297 RepID=UPI0033E5DCD7